MPECVCVCVWKVGACDQVVSPCVVACSSYGHVRVSVSLFWTPDQHTHAHTHTPNDPPDDFVHVQWSHGHDSWFHTGWLFAHRYDHIVSRLGPEVPAPPTADVSSASPALSPTPISTTPFTDVMHSNHALHEALEQLTRCGAFPPHTRTSPPPPTSPS
jgi:hypothetical protein